MMYRMKLLEKPFEQIKKGEKQIEVRCFDEKRRNIKAGDTILFSKLPQEKEHLEKEILTRVVEGSIISVSMTSAMIAGLMAGFV